VVVVGGWVGGDWMHAPLVAWVGAHWIAPAAAATSNPGSILSTPRRPRSEVFLMMRTLRDMNMSKFVAEDVPLFLSLIDDIFPGQQADKASFPDITGALEKVVGVGGRGGGKG
jgi:hypothetical protein